MARKAKGSGVGRGNGDGSVKTRFKAGMPSANPHGRPRKPKDPPTKSLMDALERKLNQRVKGQIDGREVEMPTHQAMTEMVVEDFFRPSTSASTRLKILNAILSMAPNLAGPASTDPSEQTIAEVLAMLAQEADEQEERERAEARRTAH